MLVCAGAGLALSVLGKFHGATNIPETIQGIGRTYEAFRDPRQFFPGQQRITVLCLGLDRNIYRSRDPKLNGMPTTKKARTDVMMVASLDLENGTVSVLSIPRDTRVKLPGRRGYWTKINQAHSEGGIPYTLRTVEQFLDIPIDHYIVIKQEAIQEVVNSLGGVRVKVDKDMDYDDNWGQLHVHLKEGDQVLDGEQTVGYMRFRHDADGDFGRIRRQQQVIQLLAQQVKKPAVILKAGSLIDAIRSYVQTDLSSDQQLALAHLFHKIDAGNVQTLALPVAGMEDIDGISYVIADDDKKEAAVDWIINGNQDAMNHLIRVELKNASGSRKLYDRVYRYLRHSGFEVRRAGSYGTAPVSRVIQHTNIRGSGRRVLETLGLTGTVEKSEDRGADVTFYIGKDLQNNAMLGFADDWANPEEEGTGERSRRSRRERYEPVMVKVRSVMPDPEIRAAEPLSVPGTAETEPAVSPAPPSPTDNPGKE